MNRGVCSVAAMTLRIVAMVTTTDVDADHLRLLHGPQPAQERAGALSAD